MRKMLGAVSPSAVRRVQSALYIILTNFSSLLPDIVLFKQQNYSMITVNQINKCFGLAK